MVLPTMTMNVNPIKYKKLSLSGNIVAGNETTRGDSVFLENETFNHLRNGARANFKLNLTERWTLAKYINITTPSFSWNSYFITEEISKIQGVAGLENDTMGVYKHAYDMSLGNFGLNTKIFGTYKFKPGMYIKGFRHTITPSASITWRPDWFMEQQNINDTITDVISGRFTEYSKYSTAMYRPNASKAATVNLSLDQNLQTKTRDRNDSTGTKYNNINLINAFRVNTSYNFLRDSMRWNNLGFVLNTTPGFLKILNVQGSISPYAMDDEGYAYDSLLWRAGQLGRLTSFRIQTEIKLARLNFSNWIYGQKESPKDDFKWNVNLRYTYNYSKPGLDPTINQSLEVRGDVSLTKDWSFQYSLPVNIEDGSFSQMGYINFKRNLHCWEMTFNYFPFQEDTWYTFTIRPKSGILQDLKYDKNRRGDRLY
jgi:hypothetical protein